MKYDYQCTRCDEVFEAQHRLNDDPPPCPKCQSTRLQRLISTGTNFTLKAGGCGWAGNGYGGVG